MITATVQEVRDAFRAFRRMGDELRLPQKGAWRVSRMINKLKPIVIDFEETQRKLFIDAGGTANFNGVQLDALVRGKTESDTEWEKRIEERRTNVNKLNADMSALNKEEAKIDYEPIPLSLFKGRGEEDLLVAPLDFADAGQFIADDLK